MNKDKINKKAKDIIKSAEEIKRETRKEGRVFGDPMVILNE